jgi:dynein heavy chain 1
LVRIWAHEALRLFQDRCVFPEEKVWVDEIVDRVATEQFNCDEIALERPILFST